MLTINKPCAFSQIISKIRKFFSNCFFIFWKGQLLCPKLAKLFLLTPLFGSWILEISFFFLSTEYRQNGISPQLIFFKINVQVFAIGYVNTWLFSRKLAKLSLFSQLVCWNMEFSCNWNFEMRNSFCYSLLKYTFIFLKSTKQNSLFSIMVAETKQFLTFDFWILQ